MLLIFSGYGFWAEAQEYEIIYKIQMSGKTGKALKNIFAERCTVFIRGESALTRYTKKIPEVADVLIDGNRNKVYFMYPGDTVVRDLYLLSPEQTTRRFYSFVGKEIVAGYECSIWTGVIEAPHLGGKATHTIWTNPTVSPKIDPEHLASAGSPFWTPGVSGFPLKKKIEYADIDLTVIYTAVSVRSTKLEPAWFEPPRSPSRFSPDRNVSDPDWVKTSSKKRIVARTMFKTPPLKAPSPSLSWNFVPRLLPACLIVE
ncbi:MAG: hypothetical protein NZ534_02455 [Bacteroidia bacterium]|nr:hypothetical protein [Bacteroidia bacterium]